MKLATIELSGVPTPGVVRGDDFVSFADLDPALPGDMLSFIEGYDDLKPLVEAKIDAASATTEFATAKKLSPWRPTNIRDFVGFEEHAQNSGKRFGLDMTSTLDSWRQFPGFYYSNPTVAYGPDEPIPAHPDSQWYDFEFELGTIIGKRGRNISAADANSYIFGFTIFNDWSARDLQMQEVKLGVGAPKSKEYANTFGPVIVTRDEFDQYLVPDDPQRYDVATKLTLNGEVLRENNLKTIYWTFGQTIEYASKNLDLVPGDVFGSGTIGGGALVEYPQDVPWLTSGDVIEMEIQGLGTLVNKYV